MYEYISHIYIYILYYRREKYILYIYIRCNRTPTQTLKYLYQKSSICVLLLQHYILYIGCNSLMYTKYQIGLSFLYTYTARVLLCVLSKVKIKYKSVVLSSAINNNTALRYRLTSIVLIIIPCKIFVIASHNIIIINNIIYYWVHLRVCC